MAFISREKAREEIEKILKNQKPIKTGQTLPIRKGSTFNVYRVPVELLVPNVLNDRIAWKTREWEAINGRKLSHDNEEDVEYVYNLIEKENPNDNDRTMKDIADKGQQIDGIITKDGIIIDGNRRATLIRKLFRGEANKLGKNVEEFRFFNSIILSEDIDDSEIMALETRIQIGEDKKVDYDPICLYIKVDNLEKYASYNENQIANFMNISVEKVKEKKEIFKLMNEYLENIDRPNHFTLLQGLEDQFINTKSIFKKLENHTYSTYGWDYNDEDVVNFKLVCYDYLRSKFEGKKYREELLGRPNKTNGIFIKKDVWDNFLENHENIIKENNPEKESDWENLGKHQFNQNLTNATRKLIDTLNDKNITSLIDSIDFKVHSLQECLNRKEEMTESDFEKLKNIEKEIRNITKDYE